MKRRFWRILFPTVIAAVVLLGYTAISAQGEYVRETYEIENRLPESELKDACYLDNGKMLLIVGSDYEFCGVLTDTASHGAQVLWQVSGGFRRLAVLDDRVIVACETARYVDGTVVKQVNLLSHDRNDFTQLDKTTVLENLDTLSAKSFAAASNGAFYFLKSTDPSVLYTVADVSEDSQTKVQELVPFCDMNEPIAELVTASPSGDIYAVSETGGLWRIESSKVTGFSGDPVGLGLRMLGEELAMDGNGELFRISKENMAVERLYASQSHGAACLYREGILADFDSALLLLDEDGGVLGQVTLEKRYPAFLFADGDMIYSLSNSNTGVRVEYTNGITSEVTTEEFTEESNAFLANPLPGIYPVDVSPEQWTVALNPELVNPGRGSPAVTVVHENTGASATWTSDNGLGMDGNFLYFPSPEFLEAGTYRVELSNLCTAAGMPARCVYTLTFTEESSEGPGSSGGDSGSSGGSSEEEESGRITSEVYDIDPKTRVMTGVEPGSTLAQIKANLRYDGDLVVRSYQGTRVSSGGVGTGATFTLLRDGIQSDQVTLLLYGDLNGDGSVNEKDVSVLMEHEFYHDSRTVLKGLFLEAADSNRDGTYTFEDLDLLYKSIYEYGGS